MLDECLRHILSFVAHIKHLCHGTGHSTGSSNNLICVKYTLPSAHVTLNINNNDIFVSFLHNITVACVCVSVCCYHLNIFTPHCQLWFLTEWDSLFVYGRGEVKSSRYPFLYIPGRLMSLLLLYHQAWMSLYPVSHICATYTTPQQRFYEYRLQLTLSVPQIFQYTSFTVFLWYDARWHITLCLKLWRIVRSPQGMPFETFSSSYKPELSLSFKSVSTWKTLEIVQRR